MIDTDKYENITPERWTVDEDDPFRVVDAQDCTIARTDFVGIHEEREWHLANARLIADAPFLLAEAALLLEEVKRLREEKKRLRDMVEKARPFLNMTMRKHVGYYDEEYRGEEE